MVDLFKEILKYLPQYIGDFLGLLRGPKAFLRQRLAADVEENYRKSLMFVAISFCLVFLMKWTGGPEDTTFKTVFIKEFILELLSYIVLAALLGLAWRIVGSKGHTREMALIYSYQMGVVMVVLGVFLQFSAGTMRMIDADQHDLMVKMSKVKDSEDLEALMKEAQATMDYDDPMTRAAQSANEWVAIIGELIVFAWLLAAWGAFRSLFDTTRVRSGVALLLFLVFDWLNPFDIVRSFVMQAVT